MEDEERINVGSYHEDLDGDNWWFGVDVGLDDSKDVGFESTSKNTYCGLTMEEAMARIRSTDVDYVERATLVEVQMGSMALCRGERGEELRRAGAIQALLETLTELLSKIPAPQQSTTVDMQTESIIKLAVTSWGAVRDLACGSPGNREALRLIVVDGIGGMQLLSNYLTLYDGLCCHDIDMLHLKLLTVVIGAMRNVTHATAENCAQLHHYGVSTMLIWRLKHGAQQAFDNLSIALPSASDPWREGAFRSASTLINMAEKCRASAEASAMDPEIITLLVESWGGNQKTSPLLHLGLAAVLGTAKRQLPSCQYNHKWDAILSNERQRKITAQKREEERKRLALSKD